MAGFIIVIIWEVCVLALFLVAKKRNRKLTIPQQLAAVLLGPIALVLGIILLKKKIPSVPIRN